MKKTIITMLLFGLATVASGETLERAEKLTDLELAGLTTARTKVWEAEQYLKKVQDNIAQAHRMSARDYMEWSTRVEFDGEYILEYYTSHMSINTLVFQEAK